MLDTRSDVYQPKHFKSGEVTSVIADLPKRPKEGIKMTLIDLQTVSGVLDVAQLETIQTTIMAADMARFIPTVRVLLALSAAVVHSAFPTVLIALSVAV